VLFLNGDHINLIMVTYHRPNDLRACLESIINDTIVPYHLHIIDNSVGAIDKVIEDYEQYESITFYKNKSNIGKPKAVNKHYDQIMKNYPLSYFVSIDSDIVVTRGWLLELVRSYQSISHNIKVGLIAPVIKNAKHETWGWQLANKVRMHNICNIGADDFYSGVFSNRYTAGPVLLINRKLFENLGKFDSSQRYGADDGILCRKCDNHGCFIGINTNTSVIHLNNDSDQEYEDWKTRNIRADIDQTGRWG